jgi:hypothetical protein
MNGKSTNLPCAHIIRFPRRRGRPRKVLQGKDHGTPELIAKRVNDETVEVIDLLLQRRCITPEQHWCAIHLRWLYTIRHGAPGLRAIDPTHIGGYELKANDPEWYSLREKEYNDAMALLASGGHTRLILDICIYNERPAFLKSNMPIQPHHRAIASAFLRCLQEGLDRLREHWQR